MKWIFAAVLTIFGAVWLRAGLEGSYLLPLDHEAIRYASEPLHDAVTVLRERLEKGETKLDFDPQFGYVPALLKQFGIPVSSQVLVFSKTSFQASRISPASPRALYFNDDVSVGYVRGGEVLEISALDPRQGVVFFTLDQEKSSQPQLVRREECLQCHVSPATLGVPGDVVRSVHTETSGMPVFQAGTFVTDDRSPFRERWGGWYVTGTHGTALHMGNVTTQDRETGKLDLSKGANITDLKWKFDTGAYLSPHSDIVCLLVLEHQSRMKNLITRVGWEARMALYSQAGMNRALQEPEDKISESTRRRIDTASEELVRYMLFTEEVPLESEVRGTSSFTREFAAAGERDRAGRSLRDFDLKRRVFRYPCSYLIYSEAFDSMPPIAKDRIYRRLFEVLTGKDETPKYASLTKADRQAVFEILLETKKSLPAYWGQEQSTRGRDRAPSSRLP